MSVWVGVNNAKKTAIPYVGANGAVKTVMSGNCGYNNAIKTFYTYLENTEKVVIEFNYCTIRTANYPSREVGNTLKDILLYGDFKAEYPQYQQSYKSFEYEVDDDNDPAVTLKIKSTNYLLLKNGQKISLSVPYNAGLTVSMKIYITACHRSYFDPFWSGDTVHSSWSSSGWHEGTMGSDLGSGAVTQIHCLADAWIDVCYKGTYAPTCTIGGYTYPIEFIHNLPPG